MSLVKNPFSRREKPTILESTKVGGHYLYPSSEGYALLCEVVGFAEKSLVVKFGQIKVYVDKKNWNDFAVPMKEIKLLDAVEDPDNKLLFIRYRNNSTWIDKLYNWYVGNRMDGKDYSAEISDKSVSA